MADNYLNQLMSAGSGGTTSNATLYIDGQFYQNMTFIDCTLIYEGGAVPTLLNNRFVRCQWRVEGAASNTLDFFRLLMAVGGKDIVTNALGLKDG